MPNGPIPEELAARLHREADAARWGLSVERFAATLARSATRALGERAGSRRDLDSFLTGLHLRDLALAAACLDGHEPAWEAVIREHRQGLYRAAEAMRPGRGHELADALYAELFGVGASGQARTSLLQYFHGRSSLGTWLRAVLAQRHVDGLRADRRLAPLPDSRDGDDDTMPAGPAGASATTADLASEAERSRWLPAVHEAMAAAIAGLEPRDRLRLSLYYVDGLTLAEIGRGLGEHEASVSRHLARTRKALRAAVEAHLQATAGLSQAEIAECLASAMADAGTLDLSALINAPPGRT